jgi:hypothetical protein
VTESRRGFLGKLGAIVGVAAASTVPSIVVAEPTPPAELPEACVRCGSLNHAKCTVRGEAGCEACATMSNADADFYRRKVAEIKTRGARPTPSKRRRR